MLQLELYYQCSVPVLHHVKEQHCNGLLLLILQLSGLWLLLLAISYSHQHHHIE